ncbi:MAG: hypothetical protein ACRECW_16795 [Phyllobacterium sp.]
MTEKKNTVFRAVYFAGALAFVSGGVAGCASDQPQAMQTDKLAGPVNTGTYPTFKPPVAATSQLTPEQQQQMRSNLKSAKGGQALAHETPAQSAEELKRLQLLAKQHGDETLSAIEN